MKRQLDSATDEHMDKRHRLDDDASERQILRQLTETPLYPWQRIPRLVWRIKPATVTIIDSEKHPSGGFMTHLEIVAPRRSRELMQQPWPMAAASCLDAMMRVTGVTDIVMEYVAEFRSELYDVATMDAFNDLDKGILKRGDVIHDVSNGRYRNDGRVLWDGKQIVHLDRDWRDDYGALPHSLPINEFGNTQFFDGTVDHNDYIWFDPTGYTHGPRHTIPVSSEPMKLFHDPPRLGIWWTMEKKDTGECWVVISAVMVTREMGKTVLDVPRSRDVWAGDYRCNWVQTHAIGHHLPRDLTRTFRLSHPDQHYGPVTREYGTDRFPTIRLADLYGQSTIDRLMAEYNQLYPQPQHAIEVIDDEP